MRQKNRFCGRERVYEKESKVVGRESLFKTQILRGAVSSDSKAPNVPL